jgi:acyl carrier protein
MADALDFQPTDALLALSSFSFDVCVMDFFLPLTHGGRVVLMRQKDAFQMKNIARVLVESDVTVMVQGPVIWRSLLEAGWTGKPDLKIVNTAEHLSQELANRLLPLGKGLWNAYGPSEITIFSSIGRITPDAPEVHIGQPAANTRYYLVDEQGGLIEDADQPGELLIAGMGICPAGYLNQPELTREKYLPNPFSSDPQYALAYRSGDRVRRLPNGNYAYIGRLDYQIKLRGFRIELGEIEAALEQHPAVRQAVAVVRQLDHPASDPQILAFVTITPQPVDLPGAEPLTARDLKKFLTRKLPVYAVPAAIVMVDRFPLTATGKVDRKRLPIPEGVIRPNGSVYIPPEEPFQEQLVGLWEQILSVSPIGIDDNLFDLGGHSLHVIQLVTAMEASLNVTIAADLVLTHPTIRQLSLAFGKTQSTLYANVYRPFVGFNTQGQKTPIFATHPLPDFARCFGWDRPFYGICQTYLSQEIPLAERSLDRVLALLLTEIRALQPRGPYNLMGYCVRSPIAWSLAAALEAEGEQVTLMLVDPNLPPPCVNIPFLLYFAMLPGLRFRVSGPSPTRRPRRRPPRPIQFTFKQPHGSNFDAYRLRPDTRARLQQMLFLQANIHTYFHFEDLTIHYANYHLPTLQAPVTFFLSSTLLQGICRFYLREIERHWAPRSAQAEIILPDIIHQKISGLAGAQTIGPIMETKFH